MSEDRQVITIKTGNKRILEKLNEMEQSGEIKSFIFAGINSDGNISTAFSGTDVYESQLLISYLQVHATRNHVLNMITSVPQDGEDK